MTDRAFYLPSFRTPQQETSFPRWSNRKLASLTVAEPIFADDGQLYVVSATVALVDSFPRHRLCLTAPPVAPFGEKVASTSDSDARPKKRKKSQLSSLHDAEQEFHESIRYRLETSFQLLRSSTATTEETDGVTWLDKATARNGSDLDWPSVIAGQTSLMTDGPILDHLVLNDGDIARELPFRLRELRSSILMPAHSGFLLSDFSTWSSHTSTLAAEGLRRGGWDVLLIDPPWPNRSAARSASYDTFDPYELWKLDVRALLGDEPCIIAVWVTNRVKYRRLVQDKLFESWGLSNVSEWYWIKTTTGGEPVLPFSSVHRRCYEGLILGQYRPTSDTMPPPPYTVFASPPTGHSRKPYIIDMLRPFMPPGERGPNVLELFARTLPAGPPPSSGAGRSGTWLAVGNEAIKFNVIQSDTVAGWLRAIPHRDESSQEGPKTREDSEDS